ncbi:MAG: PaaI family thioesterase [Anaerolineae bacterium]|nr:PaaI family thioesterase [Anaerolineae bacterium]
MLNEAHFNRLQWIYRTNPCNQHYTTEIVIAEGKTEIVLPIRPDYLHGGGVVHGSVYFKLLDDAGTFAVNSLVKDFAILTASFNIYFTRPISTGSIRAVGRVVHESRRLFIAEAEALDMDGRLLARGSGSYMRSTIALPEVG